MITRTSANWQTPAWQRELAEAITDPAELWQLLALPPDLLPAAQAVAQSLGLKVPRSFVALMEPGNTSDPLLRQVLPVAAELTVVPGFGDDPVGDQAATAVPGLLNKYPGRALLIASPACAVHCRYCFRRAFPYSTQSAAPKNWRQILEYLSTATTIREVILSGGDPLTLDDRMLAELITRLAALPHIERLRIHTRLPILIPQRITQALLNLLVQTRLTPVVVVHVNHPRELSAAVITALQGLRRTAVVLNQAVLLRGVNDDLEVLTELSERLFTAGVVPYYLHLLDRVKGAAHFEVAEVSAILLLQALRQRLPGYLVPRLAREEPGAVAKTVIL